MTFNLADLFEAVVDAVPDREALVVGGRRLSYRALDERANRLARWLASEGIGAGDHVGLYLMNGTEYVEGMLAAFKLRAVPINVNYRYVERELAYLFDNAAVVALIHHRSFTDRIASVASELPGLKTFLAVDDGSDGSAAGPPTAIDYQRALASSAPERPEVPARSSDDLYCVYTGGTTGLPKGVLWRHEDIFKAAMGGGDLTSTGNWVSGPEELAERAPGQGLVALCLPPLMHSSAHWLVFHQLFTAGTTVLVPLGRFDPAITWGLVTRERPFTLVITGDAMARPLVDELEANQGRYDASSLWVIGSGGAILSEATKRRFLELLPNRMIVDGFGSSETGVVGNRAEGVAGLKVDERTAVLDDDGRPVPPGSGVIGRLAKGGHVPIGYHKDPERTARTFIERGGMRWALPGDMATVEADGSITLLGRGSVSINTGGEKVFPEEVERPLKEHAAVRDAVVVGVPDERWGERVVAVVEPSRNESPTLGELQDHCRAFVAGYKVPRDVVLVDRIERSPAGKPDYAWARERALESLGART